MHGKGWGMRAPLLPGHGHTRQVFADQARAAAWLAAARAEWAALRARYARPVLMGQSMGGALAVVLAAESPPAALVLFAPYLRMGWRARALARAWPLTQWVLPWITGQPERSLLDPVARAAARGVGGSTPRTVNELRQLVAAARRAAPAVRVPVLVVQGRNDYRVPSRSVRTGFAALGSPDKTLLWREGVGHVVAADRGREEVFALVQAWLGERLR